jgi:hypothetical protein
MSCVNVIDNDTTLLATFPGEYDCASRTSTHDTTAVAILRFLPTGVWEVRAAGSGGTGFVGVIATGNWITGTFNPADYEVRFSGVQHDEETTALSSPCCGLGGDFTDDTPFDSGWLGMGLTREQQIVARHAYSAGACNSMQTISTAPINVQIRNIANPANNVSGVATLCAQGDATTTAPPCLPGP